MRNSIQILVLGGLVATGAALLGGCDSGGGGSNNDNDITQWPRQICPGDPACPDEGDGTLHAGATIVDLTPIDLKEGPVWTDNNQDFLFDERDDDFDDLNGNGVFDAVWIAGNEFSRPAVDVHDSIEARIMALRHNETTVVFVALDYIGFFLDYKDRIESLLPPAMQDQIDLVIMGSTHNHQGPDTVGIWGRNLITSGLDPDYLAEAEQLIADGIADAVNALEPAQITYGAIDVEEPDGDLEPHVSDTRDPVIIDNRMNVMRLSRPGDDSTIATLMTFAFHPEVRSDENNSLTADMVYYLRQTIEDGIPGEFPGVGGVAIYWQGACGGQIGPGRVRPFTRDRTVQLSGATWERTEAVGQNLGDWALRALDPANGAVTDPSADIYFRTRRVFASVENFTYQAAYRLGIFNRALHNWNPEAAIDETNIPEILTELVYIRIGRASMASVPGELHPELFIGCYDGSCAGLYDFVDPNSANPPDLSTAPGPPYIRDLLAADGSEFWWLLGLTQDMLGYIMPDYNYQLHPTSPYLFEPDGDHYEETNSLGPSSHQQLIEPLRELLEWQP